MALTHLTFLDGGPTLAGMKKHNATVTGFLADLGNEIVLGNSPDMCEAYLKGLPTDVDDLPRWLQARYGGTFLYPNAITIPGPSHLLDWVTEAAVLRSFFWK